ncbi:twitching motility protein PilT [Betaproteobacteria bacterium]|nr:twitching motility protein PilT [Betaproteobacteria bacterium]
MRVLVDTSVWVDHFKNRNEALVRLLLQEQVLTHPMIRVELVCGTPPEPRRKTLDNIGLLYSSKQVGLDEVMEFIEHKELYGLGCGLVDLVLLCSTLVMPNAKLWTLDKRLAGLAERFGVAYLSGLH